jgi:hypothetical protein
MSRRLEKDGWGIFEKYGSRWRRYIPRLWKTQKEAQLAWHDLLKIYPKDSQWRTRLVVVQVQKPQVQAEETREKEET